MDRERSLSTAASVMPCKRCDFEAILLNFAEIEEEGAAAAESPELLLVTRKPLSKQIMVSLADMVYMSPDTDAETSPVAKENFKTDALESKPSTYLGAPCSNGFEERDNRCM